MYRRCSTRAAAGVLLLALAGGAGAQPVRPARPSRQLAALVAAVKDVEAGRQTTPLIGESSPTREVIVTFLAQRVQGRVPRIVSDVTGWGERLDGTFDFAIGRMMRVGRTDWYALRVRVARKARIEYMIAYGAADHRLDPHNPRQAGGITGAPPRASELVTPGYVPPEEPVESPPARRGALIDDEVASGALGGTRRVTVYRPAGYDARLPVAVFLDSRARQVAPILDLLIARGVIPPVLTAFTETHLAGQDLSPAEPLATFLAGELLDWLADRYGVVPSPERTAILAISFGAKDALDTTLSSRRVGSLGLLIPGRRITRADIRAAASRTRPGLTIAILAGRYDLANVATARALRDALAGAGDDVRYLEVPEGHSPRTWLNHVADVLRSLFGKPSG